MATEAHLASGAGRPLVTFALFAYNQERYVREAIEAAFAQTYQPLEIILSDDCSPDGTFAIMQDMAAAYTGPHKVTARQSPKNRGLLRHVLDVVKEARGKYVVVAAGDDVSFAQRAERLCALLEQESADFAWSAYRRLEQSATGYRYFTETYERTGTLYGLPVQRIVGATAAYRTDRVNTIQAPEHPIYYEDNLFELLCEIKRLKVCFCDEELLSYRVLPESLSMNYFSDAENFETRMMVHLSRLSDTLMFGLDAFADDKVLGERPELQRLRDTAMFYKAASAWRQMGVWTKLKILREAPDRKARRWFLPRVILGWRAFIAVKNLQLKLKSTG